MSRTTGLIGMMVALLLLAASAAQAWYPLHDRYARWQKDRPLTFGGWHNCCPEDGRIAERIERFKAAGLNEFLWIKPAPEWFRAAAEAGLPWRTSMRGSRKRVHEVMTSTPGCAGLATAYGPYDQSDELEDLVEWTAWSRKNFPDVLSYAMLVDRRFDYDRYIKQCAPDILAVEHFPIDEQGHSKPAYFPWLAKVADAARRNHLPLWVTIQAFTPILARPRLPTFADSQLDEADMRFQVFLSLAHGATGMHFFMYYGHEMSLVVDLGTPDPGSTGAGLPQKYESTMLNRAWYAVRDMAPEVQTLGRALLQLRPSGPVTYAGAVPANTTAFEGDGPLRSVAATDDPEAPLAIGRFDDAAGEAYFMVVNLVRGPRMSKLDGARTVRLTWNREVQAVERLNRLTDDVETLATDATKATEGGETGTRILDIRLEGGTGDLFKWSNGSAWDLRPPRR